MEETLQKQLQINQKYLHMQKYFLIWTYKRAKI